MSSTDAASSSLCMVAFGSPKSTTGAILMRNRPSEVPPAVESSGVTPVSSLIAAVRMSNSGPAGLRNASPEAEEK